MQQITRILFKSLPAAFLGLVALSAADITTLKPKSTVVSQAPVVESTLTVFPPIQPRKVGEYDHENPDIRHPHHTTGNQLRLGAVDTYHRGYLASMPLFPGISGVHNWVPPDCTMAVGPDFIVTTVNSTLGFFSKQGTETFQQDLNGSSGFFGSVGATDFVFDPKVFYDATSQRFFVVALDGAGPDSFADIAVSQTSDPNGTWFKYRIHLLITATENQWFDYPGWGFNKDGILLTGNMFGVTSGGFFQTQALVLQKAPMLTGAATTITQFLDATGSFTIQSAQTSDPNIDHIYATSTNESGAPLMTLWAVSNITTSPIIQKTDVPIPAWQFNSATGSAPSRNGFNLDSVPVRQKTAVYRNGYIYTTHGVSVNNDSTRMEVRWYQFQTNGFPSGTPTLVQSGSIQHPGGSTIMGAINSNSLDDVSVLYTRCSSSITADLMMVGRKATDALGTMSAPVLVKASDGSVYNSFVQHNEADQRWGDYFSVSVDPTDDVTFWGIGMYGNGGGDDWITWIQSWTISSPVPAVEVVPGTVEAFTGLGLTGGPAELATQDGIYCNLTSTKTNSGQVAAQLVKYALPNKPVSKLNAIVFEGVANSPSGSTNQVFAYNVTTGKYDLLIAQSMFGRDKTIFLNLDVPQRYVNVNNEVWFIVRSLIPPRKGFAPFTLKIDQATLGVSYNK